MPVPWPPKLPQNFPLTVNARGYIKRIAGKVRWIAGKVDPETALAVYHRKAAALMRGQRLIKQAAAPATAVTVHWLLGKYLADRKGDLDRGELSTEAFDQIRRSCQRVDAVLADHRCDAITPDVVRQLYDRLSTDHGNDAAKRAVSHFATACRHAVDHEWIAPVRLGKVGKLTSRGGPGKVKWRIFAPADIAKILRKVDEWAAGEINLKTWMQLKAGILLALNGGLGSMECSQLTVGVVDLAGGLLDFARGKTGQQHVVPLWPETIAALRPVLALRASPDDLVFVNRGGRAWNYSEMRERRGKLVKFSDDTFKARFGELLRAVDLKRKGENFYKLRHLFATTGSKCRDNDALSVLMGHGIRGGSRAHYIRIEMERLREVAMFIRQELLTPYLQSL